MHKHIVVPVRLLKRLPVQLQADRAAWFGSIGIEIDVDQTWNMALRYNVYFGPQPNGTAAFIKDRDNVAFTVKRTF